MMKKKRQIYVDRKIDLEFNERQEVIQTGEKQIRQWVRTLDKNFNEREEVQMMQ